MIPASTSPVPAVASRASPVVDHERIAVGIGDHRRRPLEQHDAPGVGGEPPGGHDPIGTGPLTGE